MNVRELLQIEIWSKRTSRILLVGAVVFVVLLMLGGYTLERFYLSPAERNAARDALTEIDRLQANELLTDVAFDAEVRTAEAKIRNSEHFGWTDRDIGVNSLLSDYLRSIQLERIMERTQWDSGKLKAGLAKQVEQWQARWKLAETEHKSRLHKLLD